MPTNNPDTDIFDLAAGCNPHWSRSDSRREPQSLVYPSQGRPERRQVAPHPAGYRPSAVEQTAGKAVAEMPGLTPSQWLRQWCCLDEQT